MRIQQSIHNKIKKGISILLSSVLTFGMAAGIIPGGVEKTLYVQAAGNQPSVMSLNGFKVTTEGKPADVAVKTINLNATVLRPDDTWSSGGNQVYFGTYSGSPVKYRVLSSPDTMLTTNKSLLLDCNTILATKTFEEAMNDSFYADTMFSNMEMGAIEITTLKACQYSYTMGGVTPNWVDNEASRHVFCLSIAEADTLYKDDTARIKTGSDFLRLRSCYETSSYEYTGGVTDAGVVTAVYKGVDKGVSPALNVSLSSVLLASVSGSTAKSSALAPVDNSTATEWKLTLLDSSKTVDVTGGQDIKRQGTTITVPYTCTGSDVSQISIMITDKAYGASDAQVLYYGKLQGVTTDSTTGTGTFTLPDDLAAKTCGTDYYAYIIAEDINVATTTDYASAPAQITIPDAPASITQVDITGIDEPVAGQPLDTVADCTSTGVKGITLSWDPNDVTAKYGTSYTVRVNLEAEEGYEFAGIDKIAAKVNGQQAKSVDIDPKGNHSVTYTFPETAKAKLVSIKAPDPITAPHGTAYKDMKLPTMVEIETEGNTVDKAAVVWDTSTPASGSYDPSVLTEQTVILNGTVTCPDNINADGAKLTATITITVKAADTVEAPIASVQSGTYMENQTVILSSPTEGAAIYYTTNGVNPTGPATGTRYDQALQVTANSGQKLDWTIKAIAVKSGMQNSAIATFTYTIDLTGGTSEEQKPEIKSHPQDAAVKTGEQAVFTVEATGNNLKYQWQMNRGTGFEDIAGATSASYTTAPVNMDCNGFKYQCVVSNSAGSDTSNVATLTVTEDSTPSETTHIIRATAGEHGSITPSGNVEVKAGESQSFDITADEGYEIEALLVDGSKAEIASSYTFENVTMKHSITVTFKQKGSTSDPEKPEKPKPAEKPKQEAEPAGNQAPQHEHNFRWVTVQTASAAQDGLEELRCDCGMVMESSVVPASRAYVNELCQNLAAAMENGSVTFDSGRIYTISDYIIRRLQDRADVTTTITFEYNHSQYRMIIPAGVDYTELLEDDECFYGYFYFAKEVGAKVETL